MIGMYGPSQSDLIGFILLVAIIGALLGVGCEKGCAYVRRHVDVEWVP